MVANVDVMACFHDWSCACKCMYVIADACGSAVRCAVASVSQVARAYSICVRTSSASSSSHVYEHQAMLAFVHVMQCLHVLASACM